MPNKEIPLSFEALKNASEAMDNAWNGMVETHRQKMEQEQKQRRHEEEQIGPPITDQLDIYFNLAPDTIRRCRQGHFSKTLQN